MENSIILRKVDVNKLAPSIRAFINTTKNLDNLSNYINSDNNKIPDVIKFNTDAITDSLIANEQNK